MSCPLKLTELLRLSSYYCYYYDYSYTLSVTYRRRSGVEDQVEEQNDRPSLIPGRLTAAAGRDANPIGYRL